MLEEAARAAAADCGAPRALVDTDLLAVVGFTVDAPGTAARLPVPRMSAPASALASALSINPSRKLYTHMGGNTPQALVNDVADAIADGECEVALLAGAEFLGGLMEALTKGGDLTRYGGAGEGTDERWGDPRDGCSAQEAAHGLAFPANVYPLFENALRARSGATLEEHALAMGRLMEPFTKVAAANPHAWFPVARSAEELVTVSPKNRMVGFPYTKYLNAIIQVDQAAALLIMSHAKADELAIAPEKRVYLHGGADANEPWDLLERVDYTTAPALGAAANAALDMAECTLAEIDLFDIYSCFPSAVSIACAELGVATDDARGLTLTGGLPYFGGPGNNYSMHAIATLIERLRAARAGARGLVTANGWFLTKHASGIYANVAPRELWRRRAPRRDDRRGPDIVGAPEGHAVIETYTVVHARDALRMGIVIGRDVAGRRFVANTPDDAATLHDLEMHEGVGRTGRVTSVNSGERNLFTPD
jgi:acetyl-CoA C-acetyltransferase